MEEKHPPCPKIERGQERLTREQEAYAYQFAQERIAAMFSLEAIDEAEAEEHLRQNYRAAGREPPTIRWFDSPLAFVRAHPLQDIEHTLGNLWKNVERSLQISAGVRVWRDIRLIIGRSVASSLWSDSLWIDVHNSIEFGNANNGWAWDRSIWAYTCESTFSVFRFFHEIFEPNHLIHWARFTEMVAGYCLGSKEAWLVRKPVRLERDEQGCLHSVDGMCLQFRDGWGFYAWHGIHVPEQVILHPEQITKTDWMQTRNLEVRRIIQERVNERFTEMVGGTCIEQGQRGELIATDLKDDAEHVAHYLHVKDPSTNRHHYLRVPPSIRRADEAVAWTFGLDERSYHPTRET